MSFSGDLEHLPIVDVIQLLGSIGKSGALSVRSDCGKAELVFRNGGLISVNHADNQRRLASIILDQGYLSPEQLLPATGEQEGNASLAHVLTGQGGLTDDQLRSSLELLIEWTIVEIITWARGSFSLDVSAGFIDEAYRYADEHLPQGFSLDTRIALMEALRIYDERTRDTTLSSLFQLPESPPDHLARNDGGDQEITVELLGLDAVDTLKKRVPEPFRVLVDHDPANDHLSIIEKELPDIGRTDRERLCAALLELSRPSASPGAPDSALVFLSGDAVLAHCITTIATHNGFFACVTDETQGLEAIIERSLAGNLRPILVTDIPHGTGDETFLPLCRRLRTRYPDIHLLLLVCGHHNPRVTLQALAADVRTVFPRPCRHEGDDGFVSAVIELLGSLASHLKLFYSRTPHQREQAFCACFRRLLSAVEPSQVSSELLQYLSLQFERCLTLVVGRTELIAERGIGIREPGSAGLSRPLMFRIPLDRPSLFREVIGKRELYFGPCDDRLVTEHLYGEIGAPRCTRVLLAPLTHSGKVIALFYADFGEGPASLQQTDRTAVLIRQAEFVLGAASHRPAR
jgi:hypothetical protein